MQGVEQFGDFAIQIRMKMMTKPGEQFVIRRKAYAMIKKAFDANGIKFAFPTVQVAGGGERARAVVPPRARWQPPRSGARRPQRRERPLAQQRRFADRVRRQPDALERGASGG